jgi:hypothetical protein
MQLGPASTDGFGLVQLLGRLGLGWQPSCGTGEPPRCSMAAPATSSSSVERDGGERGPGVPRRGGEPIRGSRKGGGSPKGFAMVAAN